MFNQFVLLPIIKNLKESNQNAFCINEIFYTYPQLAENVSKIRHALHNSKFKSKNIGLVVNDDIETYASIISIWLEGLAYVPLHPLQPKDRSIEIIKQADIELVITSGNEIDFEFTKVIESSKLEYKNSFLEPKKCDESDLAYILFTSGSTGKPKGVSLSRMNIGAFIKSFMKAGFELDSNDRCLQCFDLTFDVSVQSFLIPLIHGACTYTIPHDQIKYSYVYGLLEDHKLTFGAMVPLMIRYLKPYFDEIDAPSMRYNILTAEASPLDLVEEWSKCIPNARIFDFYGPTEATIYCTYYEYKLNTKNKSLNGMLSIGKAMDGLISIIVDENFEIIENGQKGELCIAGPQLTPGYWNNEEKNKQSFFYKEYQGEMLRFYKTGDSCYFDSDGDIMLAGRMDYQVKIQGYRIELGEIEFHAREGLERNNAVAVAFNNNTGNTEIALFIETNEENSEKKVIEYLKTKLPYYMIPTKVTRVPQFPLNTSGKVDRLELKKLLNN